MLKIIYNRTRINQPNIKEQSIVKKKKKKKKMLVYKLSAVWAAVSVDMFFAEIFFNRLYQHTRELISARII